MSRRKFSLDEFRRRAESFNPDLEIKVSNQGIGGEEHWRIVGGICVVHWWPYSKRRTAFCGATRQSYQSPGIGLVLDLTTKGEKKEKIKDHNVTCPECGTQMVLKTGGRFGHGKWYGCPRWPDCNGTHGCHKDGTPLGIPADRETKEWRIQAHDAFDAVWKGGAMSRTEAYRWLATSLGLELDQCHIGSFNKETCEQVVNVCNPRSAPEKVFRPRLLLPVKIFLILLVLFVLAFVWSFFHG